MRNRPAFIFIAILAIILAIAFLFAIRPASAMGTSGNCIYLPVAFPGSQSRGDSVVDVDPVECPLTATPVSLATATSTATILPAETDTQVPTPTGTATPIPTTTVALTPVPTETSTLVPTRVATSIGELHSVDAFCDKNEAEAHLKYKIDGGGLHLVLVYTNNILTDVLRLARAQLVEIAADSDDVIRFELYYPIGQKDPALLKTVRMDCLKP